MRHGRIRGALLAGVVLTLALAAPAGAITNGQADDEEHPYVGELFFYVPDEIDPRFDDPGAWFTCSGTLLDADTVLTAGHCTYGIGRDGGPAAETPTIGDANGGTDVWVDFAEAPDFGILPRSATFAPSDNA